MTKKDFEAFAKAIRGISDDGERRSVAFAVAAVCKCHNDAFDAKRFYKACIPE